MERVPHDDGAISPQIDVVLLTSRDGDEVVLNTTGTMREWRTVRRLAEVMGCY